VGGWRGDGGLALPGGGTIEWYLPVVMDMDAEALEYVVLHELAHVLLNEMRESRGEGGTGPRGAGGDAGGEGAAAGAG